MKDAKLFYSMEGGPQFDNIYFSPLRCGSNRAMNKANPLLILICFLTLAVISISYIQQKAKKTVSKLELDATTHKEEKLAQQTGNRRRECMWLK